MSLDYGSTIFESLLMFICFLFHWMNVFNFMISIFFIMVGLPMTYSSVSVMALVGYEDKAIGSAIMSFITMSITLVTVFVLTLLLRKNLLVMDNTVYCYFSICYISLWEG
ncbi:hypothetical protein [Coxiella-like endosymbiont]|uniref:hypothetical protein n=1 Tax=Coxiella-like endosymbiont TaxID=1592897 RepID=UPI00272C51D1|nr:hypothetical protein [Coxiella-like endosymbiont]